MKLVGFQTKRILNESRPVRGAWIETPTILKATPHQLVAPRAGRVD